MRGLLLPAILFLTLPPAIVVSEQSGSAVQRQNPPPAARVDINRASAEELMKAAGMSRTWAERIVRFRPYRTKLDLVDKGVVPASLYERIKDFVVAHRDKPESNK